MTATKENKNTSTNSANKKAIVVQEDECRNAIVSLLNKRTYTKKELYLALQQQFQTIKTETTDDDNALKGIAGNLLSKLISEEKIALDNGKYSLSEKAKIYLNQPADEDTFEKALLERLVDNGGLYFEKFVSVLLEKYYAILGMEVIDCKTIGGSADGGIDIVLDLKDYFGFEERIMVQAKCRKNSQVTEKEIREFYGALNANNGTKGIFATTSTFHQSAEKLLLSINNCVGIDGHKLFDLIKKTTYGIRKNKDGYIFDETVFEI